jgi:tRNA (guanine37-N1)-methyltransferase
VLIDVISLFPDYFRGPFDVSILKRAREKGLLEIRQTQLRDFAEGKQRKVDDRPYGGGPGMVLMPEPLTKAIRSVKNEESHTIFLSPQGAPLTPAKGRELAKKSHLILVCGHYEGIDQRIIDREIDEEISIGDYVLTNGCLAAIVLIDVISRFIPGVLGDEESAERDSFENNRFAPPQYTRPELFEGIAVPDVLRQGNHVEIEKWREQQAVKKTERVRRSHHESEPNYSRS